MDSILNLSKNLFDKLNEETKGLNYSLFCNGATQHINALLASYLLENNKEYVIYVCENSYQANKMYDKISEIVGYEKVNLYIVDDVVANESIIVNNELKQERINTIKSIINNEKVIIVTHIEALLKPVMSFEKIKKYNIEIKLKEEMDINELVKKLIIMGYVRVHTTYNVGEFSVRGEVLDIYPSCSDKPIRINFGFDEVETIKYFDLETQLTLNEKIEKINIMPINEYIIEKDISIFRNKILSIDKSKFI